MSSPTRPAGRPAGRTLPLSASPPHVRHRRSGPTQCFGTRVVVDGVDRRVCPGEIHGVLGPNGSGKTTSIRMLASLLTRDSGRGTCLGHDVLREQRAIWRDVGYLTQRFSFREDFTLEKNLDCAARLHAVPDRRGAVRRSLGELGLVERRHLRAGELSGSWKQRLALAACLIPEPKLLLLDEPTAGVDPQARRDFWEELRRLADQGRTFLVTTHYRDEAERCDRLGFIACGRLLATGTVGEVVRSAGLVTWQVRGPDFGAVAAALRARPGVEHVTAFGGAWQAKGGAPATAEVRVGIQLSYVAVGYVQVTLILMAARWLFGVPMEGSLALLYACALVFIAANLSMGLTFSTLARNQLQAVQMAFCFFLPSLLLSGFMFPFRGMPEWARALGSALPLTDFLRLVRAILLKGAGAAEVVPHLWPIAVCFAAALALGVHRYRQTLD